MREAAHFCLIENSEYSCEPALNAMGQDMTMISIIPVIVTALFTLPRGLVQRIQDMWSQRLRIKEKYEQGVANWEKRMSILKAVGMLSQEHAVSIP